MKKIRLLVSTLLVLQGCATTASTGSTAPVSLEDYSRENVAIRTQQVPDWSRWNTTTQRWGLGEIRPLIPAIDGKGLLMASWTPSPEPNAPTVVIAHGGGGIGGIVVSMGSELARTKKANVLILDSIWSRGRKTNGGDSIAQSGRTLSSNVRMFDLAAAGKWLATQGVDPARTYAIGESQGGWGVLRAFTDDTGIADLIRPYYAGGIAIYPKCEEPGTRHTEASTFEFHRLGPYHSPVLLITGGKDTLTPVSNCSDKTLRSAAKWLHWEDATHAFNLNTSAPNAPVDGVCHTYGNGFGAHKFCYNQRRTHEMMQEIGTFIK